MATATLVRQNINNVIENGCVDALTGPIERCDLGTVEKHLACLGEEDAQMYRILGTKLVTIAEKEKSRGGLWQNAGVAPINRMQKRRR